MQRCDFVAAVHGTSRFEQRADLRRVVVPRRVYDAICDDPLFQGVGTVFEEQRQQILISLLQSDLMRRVARADRPSVDVTAGARVFHLEVVIIDSHFDLVDMLQHEIAIAERGSHQNVGAASTLNQVARHIVATSQRVLRRRRFVVDVKRVENRAFPKKVLGRLDIARDMQRRLAVAALHADASRICRDQLAQLVDHAVPRRRVSVDDGAA